jgi:hypothetical protein
MSCRPGIQHVIQTSSEAAILPRARREPFRRGGSARSGRNRQRQFRIEHSGQRDFVKLARAPGVSPQLLDTIIDQSAKRSQANLTHLSPQITELIQAVEQWMEAVPEEGSVVA